MSMEDAIKELASSMRDLAQAIHAGFSSKPIIEGFNSANVALTKAVAVLAAGEPASIRAGATVQDYEDEINAEVDRRNSASAQERAATKADPAQEFHTALAEQERRNAERETVKPDPELEAAVQQVEADAKRLDYKTDVRPVLLQLAKVKGQQALKDLLEKFGAKTGDKLEAEHYGAIVADANKLIAG